jgi:hypothetical protein
MLEHYRAWRGGGEMRDTECIQCSQNLEETDG